MTEVHDNLKTKIISCHGKVTMKSAAIMCGCAYSYVRYVQNQAGLKTTRELMYGNY